MTRYGSDLVGDVAEHRAEDGDPDAAGDEDVLLARVLGQQERALRLLDLHLVADLELRSVCLKAVSRSLVASPTTPPSVGEVASEMWRRRPFSSSWPRSGSSTQKYAARPVVRIVLDGEEDEQRSLRDLPLLGDRRLHGRQSTVSRRRRPALRARSPRPAAAASASAPRSARSSASRRRAAARPRRRGRTASGAARRPGRAAPSRRIPGSSSYGRPTLPGLSSLRLPHAAVVLHVRVRRDDARGVDAGRELGDTRSPASRRSRTPRRCAASRGRRASRPGPSTSTVTSAACSSR